MRRVDEDQAIGSGHQSMIRTLLLGFDDHVTCQLLHKSPFRYHLGEE